MDSYKILRKTYQINCNILYHDLDERCCVHNWFVNIEYIVFHWLKSHVLQKSLWLVAHISPLCKTSILDGLIDKSPDDNHSFAKLLKIIRTLSKAVGKDMIIALAKFSKCCIKVDTAHSKPLVYQPLTSVVSDCSVNIAFYEPGHYRAVLPIDNACNDGDMQLDNINTFIYDENKQCHHLRDNRSGNFISPANTYKN